MFSEWRGSLTQNLRNAINLVWKKDVIVYVGHGIIHRDAIIILLKSIFGWLASSGRNYNFAEVSFRVTCYYYRALQLRSLKKNRMNLIVERLWYIYINASTTNNTQNIGETGAPWQHNVLHQVYILVELRKTTWTQGGLWGVMRLRLGRGDWLSYI